jgi:hypothetical protein
MSLYMWGLKIRYKMYKNGLKLEFVKVSHTVNRDIFVALKDRFEIREQ